jgi:hypothetical protein
MHSAQHYRERAEQARRLARGVTDRDLQQQLEALARQYDSIADRMEQLDREKPSGGT